MQHWPVNTPTKMCNKNNALTEHNKNHKKKKHESQMDQHCIPNKIYIPNKKKNSKIDIKTSNPISDGSHQCYIILLQILVSLIQVSFQILYLLLFVFLTLFFHSLQIELKCYIHFVDTIYQFVQLSL